MTINKSKLINCQTIFLDRDGVINERIIDGYVTKPNEFIFIEGVIDAIKFLSDNFKYIFIVTNQQGVSKNIMTLNDVFIVHEYMMGKITDVGGRIDGIFICPDLADSNSINRKPNIGMALQAKKQYPDIDFDNSIMIGDSASDIEFGKRLNMTTIKIGNKDDFVEADMNFNSLINFINFLRI